MYQEYRGLLMRIGGEPDLGEYSLTCERPAINCRSEVRLPEQLVVADCAKPVRDLEHG